MRRFFLGGLCLLSHKTTADCAKCIGDLKNVCQTVGGFCLSPVYCMLDGEAAIHNALQQIFENVGTILMCFFHIMKNCKEHLTGVPAELKKKFLKKIRQLHTSTNAMEFHVRLAAFSNFLIENNMQAFLDYFVSTWVNSSFCFWRIFDTIPGVGNTNNAVEAFHDHSCRHFNASFLDNKKYLMDQLVQVICWMIRFYSCKDMNFAVYIFFT